jgi:hypothetical protein
MDIGERTLSLVAHDLGQIRIDAPSHELRSLGRAVLASADSGISQATVLPKLIATFGIERRYVDVMIAVWADYLPPRAQGTKGESWEAVFEFEDDLEMRKDIERVAPVVGQWSNWSTPLAHAIKSPSAPSDDPQLKELVQRVWAPFVVPLDTDFLGEVRYSTRSVLFALLPCWDLKELAADLGNFLTFRKVLAAIGALLPSKGLSLSWGPNAETDHAWSIPKGGLEDFQFLEQLFLRLHPGLAYDGVVRASVREAFKTAEFASVESSPG